ncbi:hypothetical protein LUZ60_000073 [Juncus effusus]|nr:hypothetical protein LUZ60_000073 [Juncus effusus]
MADNSSMSDNLMEKVTALGERLKITGTEVGKKVSDGINTMSFKMKELFQGQSPAEKIVEEATSEAMDGPDWAANLEICDMMNSGNVNSVEFVRGIKKRIMVKHPMVQYLALVLLETCVKNSERAFSEVAAERVLDEMVRLIDDPQTLVNNRNKALVLVETWGQSGDELRYLPVYEETYKSLKSRGIRFPDPTEESSPPIIARPQSSESSHARDVPPEQVYGEIPPVSAAPVRSFTTEQVKEAFDVARNSVELLSVVLSSSPTQDALQDDLTATLVQQCKHCQFTLQHIIETLETESTLFEALNINDEIQKVLNKYEELKAPHLVHHEPEPPVIPAAEEPELEDPVQGVNEESLVRRKGGERARGGEEDMMDDLDEMIFGTKGGTSEEGKKKESDKDDLIRF